MVRSNFPKLEEWKEMKSSPTWVRFPNHHAEQEKFVHDITSNILEDAQALYGRSSTHVYDPKNIMDGVHPEKGENDYLDFEELHGKSLAHFEQLDAEAKANEKNAHSIYVSQKEAKRLLSKILFSKTNVSTDKFVVSTQDAISDEVREALAEIFGITFNQSGAKLGRAHKYKRSIILEIVRDEVPNQQAPVPTVMTKYEDITGHPIEYESARKLREQSYKLINLKSDLIGGVISALKLLEPKKLD